MSEDDREELENGGEDGTNRLAWFITGAIIGVTVALLYAPKSGKHTRRLITDKTQQGKDKVTDAVTDASSQIAETSRDMFERGRKVVEEAADLFDRARKLVRG
jgi:gas vesicle protein